MTKEALETALIVKTAAEAVVKILGETLNDGIGFWDFSKLAYAGGAAMTGGTPGAGERGKEPMRIWIGAK